MKQTFHCKKISLEGEILSPTGSDGERRVNKDIYDDKGRYWRKGSVGKYFPENGTLRWKTQNGKK